MTFWFGFLAIWSAVGIPAGLIALVAGQWQGLLFVVAPILMFGFGVGFVKFGGGYWKIGRSVSYSFCL